MCGGDVGPNVRRHGSDAEPPGTRSARVALRRTLRLALHATARRVAAVYYCAVRRRRVCRAARSIGGGSYWLPVAQRLEPLKVAPALRLHAHRSAVWLGMPQKTAAMR